MNRFFNLIFIGFLLSLLPFPATAQVCKTSQISKSISQFARSPYKYDSHTVNEFIFDSKEKKFEVQFTAFKGLKYKILFSTSGYEEDITINIYDKSAASKKERKNLMENSQKMENSYWVFEPQKAGNYYIEYNIPKSLSQEDKNGCILMVIAYTEK